MCEPKCFGFFGFAGQRSLTCSRVACSDGGGRWRRGTAACTGRERGAMIGLGGRWHSGRSFRRALIL